MLAANERSSMILYLDPLYSSIIITITFELCISLKGKRPLTAPENTRKMKDGWAVANPQMLSYCFIPRNVPKPSSYKPFMFPIAKARIELFQCSRLL